MWYHGFSLRSVILGGREKIQTHTLEQIYLVSYIFIKKKRRKGMLHMDDGTETVFCYHFGHFGRYAYVIKIKYV